MPRIDPLTGCTVVTTIEFLAQVDAEDQAKGLPPGFFLNQMAQEEASDEAREMERLRAEAWPTILAVSQVEYAAWQSEAEENGHEYQTYRHDPTVGHSVPVTVVMDAGPPPPQPTALIEVLEAGAKCGMRETSGFVRARVMCSDGQARVAKWFYASWPGSFYEPPDEDEGLTWETEVIG